MKTYYRALPQTVVGPPNSHHVGEFQQSFDWVSGFNEASRGSLDCVQVTQRRLKQWHCLETTLVEVKDEKLMTPMYVISLEVEEGNSSPARSSPQAFPGCSAEGDKARVQIARVL
jgi:hypothetical protein